MSDVFVSYKAEDRRRVQPLVAALEADGLTVWWDAQIGGGDEWRRSIERELEAAKCVLVVWSKRSTAPEGRFVRDEASRAMDRGVYLPVRIDNVRLPLGFGETQALSLSGWRGSREDGRFQAVLGAVQTIVAGKPHEGGHRHLDQHHVSRRGVLAGSAVATAALAGLGGWLLLKPGSAEAAGSIAVLPFANLSSDPGQAYFSDGLTEELRSALSRAGLQVVGRTSSEAVKSADAETAARKLGVANILTGSVRRSPSTMRISAQLIKGSDGLERWSQDYDRKPGDELTIQSDIAQNVAQALSVALGKAAKAAISLGGTTNPAAQDLYLKAREQLRISDSEATYRNVIGLLDSATTLDPRFADAYAWKSLAINYMTGSIAGAPSFEAGYAQAEELAKQAIALAPALSAGHVALATAYEFQLKLPAALAEYRTAQRTPDVDIGNQLHYVIFLTRIGAFGAALDIVRQVEQRDPLNSLAYGRGGYVLAYSRRYADAIAPLQKAIQLAPTVSRTHSTLGLCLMQLGRNAEAEAEYRKATPDEIYRLVGEAILFARQGDTGASNRALARAQQVFGDQASYQYAEIYAQRGDKERAFAALDRAWAIRDPGLTTMQVDFFLDPLRSDSRFAALERKLNFPPPGAA
jgi:serine/threonine-protein kinase